MPVIPEEAARWPADFVARARKGLKPAGVLIALIERENGLMVLLTERAAALKLHAGQISFPGGGMEQRDPDILATALRETHEEVGIAPSLVDVVGFLEPSATVTGYSVTPVIGVVHRSVRVTIDPSEVQSAFEVPLDFLMHADNQLHTTREFGGVIVPIVEFHYAERRIWGATASMLVQLKKELIKQ